MKMIEITCDNCEKEINKNTIYGSLCLPLLPELNFCGVMCFDDWIKNIYLKNRKKD